MPAGRSKVFVTAKRPPVMSSVAVRPLQLSSQTAHSLVLSGSYVSSMTFGKPLSMLAIR